MIMKRSGESILSPSGDRTRDLVFSYSIQFQQEYHRQLGSFPFCPCEPNQMF